MISREETVLQAHLKTAGFVVGPIVFVVMLLFFDGISLTWERWLLPMAMRVNRSQLSGSSFADG